MVSIAAESVRTSATGASFPPKATGRLPGHVVPAFVGGLLGSYVRDEVAEG